MYNTLRPCNQFAIVYIDDVLIFSSTVEDHLNYIRRTLTALKEAGLKVKPQKCQWGKKMFLYLGHFIGDGKVAVPRHRVTVMEEYKQPVTKNNLQHFMGNVNYYGRFVPGNCNYSAELSPQQPSQGPRVRCSGLERCWRLLIHYVVH